MTPTFSVVLPTYNRAYIILEAIHSVLNQTCRDFELIIVDDGSTDGTKELVKSLTDARLRYTQNTHAKGAAGARNTGIELARGAWLCQIDSDDLWAPDMLELFATAIAGAQPSVGIVYGSHALIDAKTGEPSSSARPNSRAIRSHTCSKRTSSSTAALHFA